MEINKFKNHILYWIILFFTHSLGIVMLLPFSLQIKLGKKLGALLQKFSPRMQKAAYKNIELCFSQLNSEQRQQLLTKSFENLGIGVFESLYSAWASDNKLLDLIDTLEGEEEIKKNLAEKESAIFLFPHMIPMYLVGHLLSLKIPQSTALMYHSPKNPAINHFMYTHLKNKMDAVFNRKNIRQMIHYLKEGNKCVWYAADVDIGEKYSEFVPFFGLQAATITAPIRIATLTKAKFFPIGFYRKPNNKYYIKIYPPLNNFPSGNNLTDLTQINQIMEEIIRQKPEQYLWQYKRFHTRPKGEQKIY